MLEIMWISNIWNINVEVIHFTLIMLPSLYNYPQRKEPLQSDFCFRYTTSDTETYSTCPKALH